MKKIIALFFAVLFLFTAGCAKEKNFADAVTCEEIVDAVHSAGKAPNFEKYYRKSKNNLDSQTFSLWADGLYVECEDFDLLEDYAMFLGAGTETYEVVVLKAETNYDAQGMKELFERRKKTLAAGDKGMYDLNFEKKMENSVVEVVGEFAIFLVTDFNDDAVAAIEKLKE